MRLHPAKVNMTDGGPQEGLNQVPCCKMLYVNLPSTEIPNYQQKNHVKDHAVLAADA